LWNAVDLSLSVANPSNVANVEVRANGNVLFRATNAPFQYTWDTRAVGDGDYTLSAVITDRQGNTTTSNLQVAVRNILLTIKVPDDHLLNIDGRMERAWVFLMSESGELLVNAEMKNGEMINLGNGTYNGRTFTLSEAYLTASGLSLDITSFSEVPRGKWTLAAAIPDKLPVGNLSVQFKDSVGTHPYFVSTNGDSQIFFEGGNSIRLQLTQSPTKLFIRSIGNSFKLLQHR